MRHPTSLLSLTLALAIATGFTTPASARGIASPASTPPDDIGFVGTQADLVGYAVNVLLQKDGRAVHDATAEQVAALRHAFRDSTDFQWANSMVLETGAQTFTVTLPASLEALSGGTVALGVVEHGTVARAFFLTMEALGTDTYRVTLARPDGTVAVHVDLGVNDRGEWLTTPQDLLQLAVVLYPSAAKGVFDPIIQTLQGILNMLYEIKDIINMAICIVNEMIEMFNDLNTCGWGETKPGGGAIAGVIVCTVQDVIEFLSEMTDHCL